MAKSEYIEKNRMWLAQKAKEEGVNPLDKGVYYKSLKKEVVPLRIGVAW